MLRSFRARLILWNVLVLALTLTAFGLALLASTRHQIAVAIDSDLLARVAPLRNPPPLPRGGFGGAFGGGFGGSGGRRQPLRPPPGEPRFRQPLEFGPDGTPTGRNPDARVFDPEGLKMALQGLDYFSNVTFEDERLRVLSVSRRENGRIVGAAQVARELRDFDIQSALQLRVLLVLLPLALVAAGGGALFLTNRALRPVAQVTAAAAEIGAQDLSRRLPVTGDDELAELSRTFNAMIARLQKSFAELQELYENQRRFTADASHELRTPLTRLQLAASSGLQETDPAKLTSALEVAKTSAETMSRLVQQLLTLSRADAGNLGLHLEPVDLRVLAAETVDRGPWAGRRSIQVDLPQEPVQIRVDKDQLARVLTNLLENADRYTPADGEIKVSVESDGDWAVLSVSDTGEGISPEHMPKIFDRFYRADAARTREDGGCGLGLSICKTIAEEHGGHIAVESQLGAGSTFKVFLPLK